MPEAFCPEFSATPPMKVKNNHFGIMSSSCGRQDVKVHTELADLEK
jgi:hypothetical protein